MPPCSLTVPTVESNEIPAKKALLVEPDTSRRLPIALQQVGQLVAVSCLDDQLKLRALHVCFRLAQYYSGAAAGSWASSALIH